MLEDGRFRGRVYGKAGVTEGKWVITSHVPPERRDLPARCVWTDSGSTYRLGQKARGERTSARACTFRSESRPEALSRHTYLLFPERGVAHLPLDFVQKAYIVGGPLT